MKWKYSIGILLTLCLISFAYYASYQWVVNYDAGNSSDEMQIPVRDVSYSKDKKITEQITSVSGIGKFYLKEENNLVTVYRTESELVYEYTNIKVSSLPLNLQAEIKNIKYLEDFSALYNFLENYST